MVGWRVRSCNLCPPRPWPRYHPKRSGQPGVLVVILWRERTDAVNQERQGGASASENFVMASKTANHFESAFFGNGLYLMRRISHPPPSGIRPRLTRDQARRRAEVETAGPAGIIPLAVPRRLSDDWVAALGCIVMRVGIAFRDGFGPRLDGFCGPRPKPIASVLPQDAYSNCTMIQAEIEANNAKAAQLANEQGGKVAQNVAAGVVPGGLWFGLDFKDAAGKEAAALQAHQQYLTTLATERCALGYRPPQPPQGLRATSTYHSTLIPESSRRNGGGSRDECE
jgi:hypothetical protein